MAARRDLIGDASKLTTRPGMTVEFMVSTIGGGECAADLGRIEFHR